MAENTLYYGDNIDVLPRYVKDDTVDLIYLDPPFNSNQNYNVLFAERTGQRSAAQIKAFEDTWRWDEAAALNYQDGLDRGGLVADALRSLRTLLGPSDMLAYLSMMAPRLVELHRVLKPTGSLYLHCDPTASHYLKLLLDSVFSHRFFRNEIIWKRTTGHRDSHKWNQSHDELLFYSKSDDFTWNPQYEPYDEEYVEKNFRQKDPDGRRFMPDNLLAAGIRRGESGMEWHGINPTDTGHHWQYKVSTLEEMDKAGRIYWPPRGRMPRIKRYLDELDGKPATTVWTNIPPIGAHAQERLGYPTQKPEALLERIINASSNPGDVVLDPFCGCGTAVHVAQRLKRTWVGVDITHLAIALIKHRLTSAFGKAAKFEVMGEPVDLAGAEQLAKEDPYQFQWWALGLVGARPNEQKRGADRGIDGRLYFHDQGDKGGTKQIIFSVKGGKTGSDHVRDLRGVVERENAEMGVLITLQSATQPMRREAADAGIYTSPWSGTKHPRIQIVTIEELLSGKSIDRPAENVMANVTLRRARRERGQREGSQIRLRD